MTQHHAKKNLGVEAIERTNDAIRNIAQDTMRATQAVHDFNEAHNANRNWAKEKKARQRLSVKAEKSITKNETQARRTGEAIITSTGQLCYDFPWVGSSPRPWKDGYTRVLIPLKNPTASGKRTLVQIVHNSKLSHGSHA